MVTDVEVIWGLVFSDASTAVVLDVSAEAVYVLQSVLVIFTGEKKGYQTMNQPTIQPTNGHTLIDMHGQ